MADSAYDSYNIMSRIMKAIGAQEAEEKSVQPTTRLEFLGNTVDTIKMTIEVSEHRRVELMNLLQSWLQKSRFTLKQLQSLIGKLSFITNCVRAGRIFINRLLTRLRESNEKQYWHEVTSEMKQNIQWWIQYLPLYNGVSILWLQDCLKIDGWLATDSSLVGGGEPTTNNFSTSNSQIT